MPIEPSKSAYSFNSESLVFRMLRYRIISKRTIHRMTNSPANHSRPPDGRAIDQLLFDLVGLLRRGRRLRAKLAALMQSIELTDSQLLVLWICQQSLHQADAGLPQHTIAEALALSPAHASTTLEQLRQRDWLASFRPVTDRRRQHWRLTNSGSQQLQAVLNQLNCWATDSMSEDDDSEVPALRLYRGEADSPSGGAAC